MKGINRWLLVIVAVFMSNISQAQVKIERFNKFRAELAIEQAAKEKRIREFLSQNQGKETIDLGEDRKGYLYDVVNGKPLYMAAYNEDAAVNVGVASIRAGGGLGLNLSGDGLRLAIWDSPGGARPSHQEFGERIITGSDFAPGGAANHATHVTGSVLAGGVDAAAQGMSPRATAIVYDFSNDVSEITQEVNASASTMILSNHSYGPAAGWEIEGGNWSWNGDENVSNLEDWRFGFYTTRARNLDEIMYDFPNYLIVWAAGNDRNDVGDGPQPPDGPYDVIGSPATNKNGITVGAVRKLVGTDEYDGPGSVVMSNFSSWGPTDDGRIKPDISAPGVSVYSPIGTSDDAYASFQGTSMASPITMGSISLIQELNTKMNGGYLTSAELKALLIHTAHEAGDADGPDYEHGWGFLNTAGMASILLKENNDNIDLIAGELAEGGTNSYTINPMADTKVKLTLVWTDLPGTPTNVQLDPENLMLINDLDMRAVGASETHEPWIMNPAVPNQAATKGDNFRDNVEKIEFTAVDGEYVVNINHKGTLGDGPQKYALVVEYVKANSAQTLYWVGGSGDWDNGANWSLTSGGESANVVPTPIDNVIFDDNSFAGLSEAEAFSITVSQNVEVAQFRWFSVKAGSVNLGGNTLTTGGDLVVLTDQVALNNGTLNLSGANGDAVVNVQGSGSGADLVFDSSNDVTFQMIGDYDGVSINLLGGTLNIEDVNLKLNRLTVTDGVLNVSNSTLELSGTLALLDETLELNWTNSEVTVPAGAGGTFDLAGAAIPMDITVMGEATIASGAEVKSITNSGTTTVNTNLRVTDLSLAAGTATNLADGNSLTVAGEFVATGTDGSLVTLESAGTAEMIIENHRKICTDFISISGVSQTGQATVGIGTNSQLAGSETGWQQRTCDNILFADFNFNYGCVNGLTEFDNLSTGDIQSNAWNFGESDPSAVDSEEANPTYTYTSAGAKSIKLTVRDAENNAFELTANTEIINNTIGGFNIVEQVGFLVSDRSGSAYQWYKDGVPIVGEETRQLQATEGGTYNILVYDGNCNRFSEDFVLTVTSIEPDPEEQQKVEEAVTVFPNPTRDYIDISVQGYNLRTLAMQLVDQSGKVVTTSNHQNINSQSFTERLTLQDKRQGFYILRFVVNENIIVNRKVILTD